LAKVLADTSVLVEYFRATGDPKIQDSVETLLEKGNLVVCGMTIAELFQGLRSEEQEPVNSLLKEAHYVDSSRHDFEASGHLGNSLIKKGSRIPLADCLIAALCLRLKMELFSLDKHFSLIPGLKLFRP
jgi:predicted nucleic acid-binding protein